MTNSPEKDPESGLRLLRRLVTVLTGVMIAGFIVLIATLVIRLNAPPLALPDTITLPHGSSATAFTQSQDWFAIVTDSNEILVYDRSSGNLRQRVVIEEE